MEFNAESKIFLRFQLFLVKIFCAAEAQTKIYLLVTKKLSRAYSACKYNDVN